MATAAPAARARSAHYIQIKAGRFVVMQLKTSAFDAGIRTELGISTSAPGDASNIIGQGKDAAFNNGCVPVVLVYQVSANKTQSARVLCSPEKADTIFANGIGKTYNNKRIVDVRFPRRRVYVY